MAVRRKAKPLLYVLITLVVIVLISLGTIYYLSSPVDRNNHEEIEVTITPGSGATTIAKTLKEKGLIKSTTYFKLYVKINHINSLKASTYSLKKSMSVKDIIEVLEKGNSYNPNAITLTFKEGSRVTDYIAVIANNTNNSKEDVEKVFADQTYLKELIDKYWFLDTVILDPNIYYPLEGYLYPAIYNFANKDVSVQTIIETLLNKMDKELSKYKDTISKSNLSVHEILTLASIIEKEGKHRDFADISSVFRNRLNISMKLQSCATTYYGMGLDFSDVGIANDEMIKNNNPYNTYIVSALPIGPISMPSPMAIDAALNPKDTNNLYFLSDNEGNTYFFATASEHAAKKNELIKAGKWLR